MARLPVLSFAIVAVAASLTTRIDAVYAAGEALLPAAARPSQHPPAAGQPTAETRVGAALASDLQRQSKDVERARSLDLQSAMIEAAEKRLDDKLERIGSGERGVAVRPVRRIVAREAGTTQYAPDDRLAALVKMYQAMRPKDAARIFERLGLDVQVDVASLMRERAMAAILAEMDPKAASTLTMALAGYAPRRDDPDSL